MSFYFSGYAGSSGYEPIVKRLLGEYEKLRRLLDAEFTQIRHSTHRNKTYNSFHGKLISEAAKKLTEEQILILMDRGNLCFGGECTRIGDKFFGRYNTD